MTLRAKRKDEETTSAPVAVSSQKAKYEEQKRSQAQARNAQKRLERAKRRVEEIENQLVIIDQELFGDAASDYVRAQELQTQKDALEEELLALYEEIL